MAPGAASSKNASSPLKSLLSAPTNSTQTRRQLATRKNGASGPAHRRETPLDAASCCQMWSALSSHARHLLDVRSSRSASATVSECRHGAIQPGHDVGGRQSGALLSCAATISGAGLGGGAAISTGGILLQRCVDQQPTGSAGARELRTMHCEQTGS
jgi:hypothetical protein